MEANVRKPWAGIAEKMHKYTSSCSEDVGKILHSIKKFYFIL